MIGLISIIRSDSVLQSNAIKMRPLQKIKQNLIASLESLSVLGVGSKDELY